MLKRAIIIEHDNGTSLELVLSKVTAVKTRQRMIHLDELPDGTWRLIYNSEHIPDISQVLGFNILRED